MTSAPETYAAGLTDEGYADLVEYLRANLAHPDDAERHARALTADHDFDARGARFEIGAAYTASRNPVPFDLGDDAVRFEEIGD